MIFELLFGTYLVLFCLGFYTDFVISSNSKDKYWWFSIPLTAPIIGFKLVVGKLKELNQKKLRNNK